MNQRIIFNRAMVREIKAGNKNQTRRLCDEKKYKIGQIYEVFEHIANGIEARHTGMLLLVTQMRCERLQNICEEDALNEGAIPSGMRRPYPGEQIKWPTEFFKEIWDTIHAPLGPNGWAANPYVWVINFRRVR